MSRYEPPQRTYWRSLEQLEGSPDYLERASREFPEGASEAPEGIPRRDMLLLLGASLSVAGMTACRRPVEKIVPYVQAPEEITPGIPMHYATTMPAGLAAYGLVVESHEGRPTKIEGNTLHPSTLGSSSAHVQAAIFGLYDADRSGTVTESGQPRVHEDFLGAWGFLAEGLDAGGGEGLAVLSEPFRSPTTARLRSELLARYPNARWATWAPLGDENVHEGLRAATGQAWQPVLHLDRAKVVLSIDADLLGSDPESIRHARAFSDARRLTGAGDGMSRLWVVEGSVSVAGTAADHRAALRSSRMGAFTAALGQALSARGVALEVGGQPASAEEVGLDAGWLDAVAEELVAHRGAGVVAAGAHLAPEVHAAVAAINAALGNAGATVAYHELTDAALPSTAELRALVDAVNAGGVETLVILGGNPAYDAPADLGFAAAMEQVATSIHLSSHVNETSALATWHLPRAHFLESWGDARAADGTLSVVQPLIEPLLGGRSDAEMLSLMASGEAAAGYDLVRATWRGVLDEMSFDREWHRVLHDGVLHGSASATATPATSPRVAVAAGDAPGPGDLELRLVPSYAVHDGSLANVSWLQELPDPITKLTWDNAALMSRPTASELGVGNGDVVRLEHDGRSLEVPAFVAPGQPDGVVALALGYGRTAAGRVGNGVGANAFVLRTSAAPAFATGLKATATGATHELVGTQDAWITDERGIAERQRRVSTMIRSATLEEYRHHPEFAKHHGPEHPPLESLWTEHDYSRGYQWGMTIDLTTCIGCNACVIACQSENNIPAVGKAQVARGREMQWLRIDRYFSGDPDAPDETVFQPVACMHCENAPCEQVCPVAATVHDGEGLNTMVYNRCIGTRYCSNNCPYKVRRFNFFNYTKDTPELLRMAHNPDVTVRSRGVMEKCTFCTQRINRAKIDAKLSGNELRDGELQTACQQACPTRAIEFGNLLDPDSRVSQARKLDRAYELLAELNNKPRTSYLARVRNPSPRLEEA